MDVEQVFMAALKSLPCPVCKPPAGGEESYVTFNQAAGDFEAWASNQPRRLAHMMQVHAFSKRDDGTHRTLFFEALRLLKSAGVHVWAFGPDDYETDTQYHHMAATVLWQEKL